MYLKNLKNKHILLFGKSRAFNADEFKMQIGFHDIKLVDAYTDEVVLIIEGAMMNPYEVQLCEDLYKNKVVKFIDIEIFEEKLIKTIDENSLLMSLKLSNNKDRLNDFLTNSKISNDLFFKLIDMYDWKNEDFFDTDNNRNTTATLISRFYKNIEKNHNIQYSKLGLMHLIFQSKDEKLIRCIANLQPLKKSLLADENDQGHKIIISIATNDYTPNDVLINLIEKSSSDISKLISMRENLDEDIQIKLIEKNDASVSEALSYSHNLSDIVFNNLVLNHNFASNIAMNIKINENKYQYLKKSYKIYLALNPTLTYKMQEELLEYNQENININLAKNQNLNQKIIIKMLQQNNENINIEIYSNKNTPKDILTYAYENKYSHSSLASNIATPKEIFYKLIETNDINILTKLAKNPSTPVELLYQLSLDMRLDRVVKQNQSFGEYIKKENIGWL